MDYYALDKDQLIAYINELEGRTISHQWDTFKTEATLLGEDLLKVVKFVYELGVKSGKQVNQLIEQAKPEPAKAVIAEVVTDVEFPY